jgi:outer membrane usher protein
MRRARAIHLILRNLCAVLVAAGFAVGASGQTEMRAPAPKERILPLEVTINSMNAGTWTLLERNGVLFASSDAFEEWRITPRAEALVYRGQSWFPLGSVPGFQARMNFANQSVDLLFSAAAFAATRVGGEDEKQLPLTPTAPSVFLNYDFNLAFSRTRAGSVTRDLGSLFELGYSSDLGVMISSFVGRNLISRDTAAPRALRRLETSLTRDYRDSNLTLRIGDGTTRTGLWGRQVYFGGIQANRNFSLTPGFVTQPLPVIRGSSSAPSTVELYINDALRQTSSVPSGPFVLDKLPVFTGSGQARLVVRDLLGRETVIVQPFFTHAELLETGLLDWSAEAGAVRLNLGVDSGNYGKRFASGIVRYGFTPELTMESRAEVAADMQNLGGGAIFVLPTGMLGHAALAGSHDQIAGAGYEWLLGIERTSLRHSFTTRAEGASRSYREIGLDALLPRTRRELSASYTYSSDLMGSLGLGLARIDTFGRGTLTTYSVNYSMRVGRRSSFNVSATRVAGATSGTSVNISLTVPLDNQITTTANVNYRGGQADAYATASKGQSEETGLGWRVLAGTRQSEPYSEGGLYYQGDRSLMAADVSISAQQQALRLGTQGALVFTDGRLFASRSLQDSFALVEVPGYPDIGVGFQGRPLTRTNKDGVALLPRLMAYQSNSIRLDPSDLPISAELDSIEQIAVPAARSGVKIVFPVRSGRGALVKLILDDGEPAPPGAEIVLAGDNKEFFVARRGEAFVTGLQQKNVLTLKWKGAHCTVVVALPAGHLDDIARVGPLTCTGVQR